jgi:hypothetical protein
MKPLIFDYKVARINDDGDFPYIYSHEKSMSMVLIKGSYIPFIDMGNEGLEIQTKTRAHRENDDDSLSYAIGTETKVARETSDNFQTPIELQTKTLVKREMDDERSFNY